MPTFDDPAHLGQTFLERHDKLYGFATDEPWELVAIRQRVSVPRSSENSNTTVPGEPGDALIKSAPCVFDATGPVSTPRLNRAALVAGRSIEGPAVVEDTWSTVIVPPDTALTVDEVGNLHMALGNAT